MGTKPQSINILYCIQISSNHIKPTIGWLTMNTKLIMFPASVCFTSGLSMYVPRLHSAGLQANVISQNAMLSACEKGQAWQLQQTAKEKMECGRTAGRTAKQLESTEKRNLRAQPQFCFSAWPATVEKESCFSSRRVPGVIWVELGCVQSYSTKKQSAKIASSIWITCFYVFFVMITTSDGFFYITTAFQGEQWQRAHHLLRRMSQSSGQCSLVTFNSVLSACDPAVERLLLKALLLRNITEISTLSDDSDGVLSVYKSLTKWSCTITAGWWPKW